MSLFFFLSIPLSLCLSLSVSLLFLNMLDVNIELERFAARSRVGQVFYMTFDKKYPRCLLLIFVARLDMHLCVRVYFLLSLAPRHSGSAISIVPAACLCVSVCLHVCACECVCMRVNEGPMHIPLSILFISGVENMYFRGF